MTITSRDWKPNTWYASGKTRKVAIRSPKELSYTSSLSPPKSFQFNSKEPQSSPLSFQTWSSQGTEIQLRTPETPKPRVMSTTYTRMRVSMMLIMMITLKGWIQNRQDVIGKCKSRDDERSNGSYVGQMRSRAGRCCGRQRRNEQQVG